MSRRQTRKDVLKQVGYNVLAGVRDIVFFGGAVFATSATYYEQTSDVDTQDTNVSKAFRNASTAVVGVITVTLAALASRDTSRRMANDCKGSVFSAGMLGAVPPTNRRTDEELPLATTPGLSHAPGDDT